MTIKGMRGVFGTRQLSELTNFTFLKSILSELENNPLDLVNAAEAKSSPTT
jgi:hypothetical protein